MSVSSSVVSLSRRGGRTSGQLSALDGSRTPSDGDRVSEARIIVSEKTTWTHLRESISAFYGEKRICNFNGCTDEMIPSGPTASQLAVDWQMLMHNDFIRYFGDYKLGDNELYDHIQIDESKLGKRKYKRRSRRDEV
ncbi:hypothetical protein RO3G_03795 [Rhizopus delemar RA 99-880]|uniref:Uncharacterized protein n=1 Tax=Rhizopus delemar (strain RA 99-880 / ATCC MYA-4621 / FGSC 9543 / NRRL 43880) TaxID=246409 RepID=I1BSB0_RHIO9|nr:hypothetical protein RO3G_03576 [Rhizopus delemar RA 99-880]EIE79090.1 hypothetical protein RO3G_03795 [Rhizopus delemar RA 99-880]|eukprot:EIE78871.1 hypothetical protein RO3G_03576 [Rhizopus delemar RA 99-880]